MNKLFVICAVALLSSSANTQSFSFLGDSLITNNINFNCGASIAYFTTHFANVVKDGLGSSILTQFKDWGINFLKSAYIKFWSDRYSDFTEINNLYLTMMEYIQNNGFLAFVEYATQHVYNFISFDLEHLMGKIRMQWSSMYPGEFKYYQNLFMMSCPFSYEFMKLTYF